MRKARITKAVADARKFVRLAEEAIEEERTSTQWDHSSMRVVPRWEDGRVPLDRHVVPGSRTSGKLRRASQDLSESLIEMRKP